MIKIITHTDLDGISCAILIKEVSDEEIDISYCSYGEVNDVAKEVIDSHENYSKIYITDISVNEEIAKELDEIKHKVVLIDHHKTALFLNDYDWAKVEVKNDKGGCSATSLVFDYLKGHENMNNPIIETFVELVRRFDTWEWHDKYNDETAKQLNDIYYLKGREDFFLDITNSFKNNTPTLSSEDLLLLKYRQKEIDRYVESKNKQIVIKDILGYKAGVVFSDNYTSELGSRLSILNPELDFIAMINQKSISYRTNKDNIDLSEISKHFGGGGHPKASGSPMSEQNISDFINMLFNTKA